MPERIDVLLIGGLLDGIVVHLDHDQVYVDHEYRILDLRSGKMCSYFVWPLDGDSAEFMIGVHSSIEDFDGAIMRLVRNYIRPTVTIHL